MYVMYTVIFPLKKIKKIHPAPFNIASAYFYFLYTKKTRELCLSLSWPREDRCEKRTRDTFCSIIVHHAQWATFSSIQKNKKEWIFYFKLPHHTENNSKSRTVIDRFSIQPFFFSSIGDWGKIFFFIIIIITQNMRIYKIAQKGNIVKQDDPIFMMAPSF